MPLEPDAARGMVPAYVEQQSFELLELTQALVGDRYAAARFDPDRGFQITVVDLTDEDAAAITEVARRLTIGEWVHVDRADPADLERWERLRNDLLRLKEDRPGILESYPSPDAGYYCSPVSIRLTADGESTAADLHTAFGDFLSLQVGALPYPPIARPPSSPTGVPRTSRRDAVSPAEMRVVLESPLTIRSGETVSHAVLLTNIGDRNVVVETNGGLTADIVDGNGVPVGGLAGPQQMPMVTYTAEPSNTVRIPLLVETASYSTELGYAVPAGTWHLTAPLDLRDGRRLRTPALELVITD